MGDGKIKRVAIIINSDAKEDRHVANQERAKKFFEKEKFDKILVSSPQTSSGDTVSNYSATKAGLNALLNGLQLDDDDILAIYITAHGYKDKKEVSCIPLNDGHCYSFATLKEKLDQLEYNKRFMIADGCYAGNSMNIFANPKTLIHSLGKPGQTVPCQTSAPYFFSDDVPDTDGDNIITIEERIAYVREKGQPPTHQLYFNPGRPMSFFGMEAQGPFEPKVIEVHSGKQLKEQLKKLKPAQLALVTFSADWCGYCQKYKPFFEHLATQYDGNFLMIRAEGINRSERDWSEWNVKGYPTVAFLDDLGNMYTVKDRVDPIASIEVPVDSYTIASVMVSLPQKLNTYLQVVLNDLKTAEELKTILMETYDEYDLYDTPPYKKRNDSVTPEERDAIRELVSKFMDELLDSAESKDLPLEKTKVLLETLARSFIENKDLYIMVDLSLYKKMEARFNSIIENPERPEELKEYAKDLLDLCQKIKKFYEAKEPKDKFGLPKGYLSALDSPLQADWKLNLLIQIKNSWKDSKVSIEADGERQIAHALLHIHQVRNKYRTFPSKKLKNSTEEYKLAENILTELAKLDFNPTEPSIQDAYIQIITNSELSPALRGKLLAASITLLREKSKLAIDSVAIQPLLGMIFNPLKNPENEDGRQVAFEAIKALPENVKLPLYNQLVNALNILTNEPQRWVQTKENQEGTHWIYVNWHQEEGLKMVPVSKSYYERQWSPANDLLFSFTGKQKEFPKEKSLKFRSVEK